MVGMSWLALKGLGNLRVSRSGQDKWLAFLMSCLLFHFFILFIFPIIKAPNKLYQVPWPWMAMFHIMVALAWIQDLRRTITRSDITFLFRFLGWMGAALSCYMLLQYLNLDPLIWLIQSKYKGFQWFSENHAIGLMGNPFHAAAALAVLVPAISYQAFHRRTLRWRTLLILSLVVMWLAQSRVAFAAALLGALVASQKVRTLKGWLTLAGLALLGFLVSLKVYPSILLDHGRIEVWTQAWAHIQRHPFLGVGLNQFKLLNIVDPVPPGYAVRWAHNEWVHFATELGIPFALLLLAYLTREAIKLFRAHRGMCACFVSSLILSFLHIPFHLAPVLVVVGLGLVTSHLEPEKE